MKKVLFTIDSVNEKLRPKNIKLIGPYVNSLTKTSFECSVGHKWESTPNNIFQKSGCPCCATRRRSLSLEVKEKIDQQLNHRDITMTGIYSGSQTKTHFKCNKDHVWLARPSNVLRGDGCPTCAVHGFNVARPAYSYIIKYDAFIKYGISNNLKTRLYSHKQNGNFILIWKKYYEVGQQALDWENNIKKKFGGRYVTKEQCPSGHTETLSLSLINEIINDK